MRDEPYDRMAWELAAESISVKIRIFGVVMGYVLVQTRIGLHNPSAVRAFLALGAGYAALDLAFHRMGEVFLKRWPLFISTMEATFITLLCFNDTGLDSPFRWYYLLSLICCAIRYRPHVTWITFGLQCLSLLALASLLGGRQQAIGGLALTLVLLAWSTWACSSLAGLLKDARTGLERVNSELEEQQTALERRVVERSEALRASQARVIHQEKMAAFGLLAAGIAHEVGNPLAALSSLLQMLRRRNPDAYTAEKLDLADRQLVRIQGTIRELVDFSRPASQVLGRVRLSDVVDEALGIAKYYQRTKDRAISTTIAPSLPPVRAVRDRLMQVVLNLVLNAIDATGKGGQILIDVESIDGEIELQVQDDGHGISVADAARLFQPYFTTKPKGTGLGLFVSRQIVEELGGKLSCQSDPGRGATFTMRLPAVPQEGSTLEPLAAQEVAL
jgi:two-component system, NtrC family, sensor kinase